MRFFAACGRRLRSRWFETLLAGGLVAALAHVDPISRQRSHFWRMILAGVAVALLSLGWERLRRAGAGSARAGQSADRLLSWAWLAAAIFGCCNYYQFDGRLFSRVGDYADATYYYLNSKYFAELGYTNLYRAMLVADSEGPRRLTHIRRFRDLEGYIAILPREKALAAADAIKGRFSPQRWRVFCEDASFITGHQISGGWRYFFIDHGYNPPPPWTLLGGTLARIVPVQRMKWITMIDFVLVCLLMSAIGRVYGMRAMFMAVVFFTCTFSGRWPILGQSILRFDWLCALVGGVLCLKANRLGGAGALLTYSALNRVFPAIFFLPIAVCFGREALRERRLSAPSRRLLIGSFACALLLGGGALLALGPQAYRDSIKNLKMHGSPESYSSHRVGLGDALLYRGEWRRDDLRQTHGGIEGKRAALWRLRPALQFVGALLITLVALFVWRGQHPLHRIVWLGVYPLFALTNPQINYYNLRLLLVLFHAERLDSYRDKLGLQLLFLTEVVTQAVMVAGATRYAVTAISSIGLASYLIIIGTLVGLSGPKPQGRATH